MRPHPKDRSQPTADQLTRAPLAAVFEIAARERDPPSARPPCPHAGCRGYAQTPCRLTPADTGRPGPGPSDTGRHRPTRPRTVRHRPSRLSSVKARLPNPRSSAADLPACRRQPHKPPGRHQSSHPPARPIRQQQSAHRRTKLSPTRGSDSNGQRSGSKLSPTQGSDSNGQRSGPKLSPTQDPEPPLGEHLHRRPRQQHEASAHARFWHHTGGTFARRRSAHETPEHLDLAVEQHPPSGDGRVGGDKGVTLLQGLDSFADADLDDAGEHHD